MSVPLVNELAIALRDIADQLDQIAASAVTAPLPSLSSMPDPPVHSVPTPPQFTPGPLPASATIADLISAVPYRSQWDKDGNDFASDCGPACVAMILQYFGTTVEINQLSRDAGMVGNRNFTLPADLIRAAGLHGVKLARRYAFNVQMLSLEIVARRPVIVLIHYGSLDALRQDRGYIKGHWVVIVGVDDQNVYIHDPDWKALHREQGRGLPVPVEVFKIAWADCTLDGNTPNQCLVVE